MRFEVQAQRVFDDNWGFLTAKKDDEADPNVRSHAVCCIDCGSAFFAEFNAFVPRHVDTIPTQRTSVLLL